MKSEGSILLAVHRVLRTDLSGFPGRSFSEFDVADIQQKLHNRTPDKWPRSISVSISIKSFYEIFCNKKFEILRPFVKFPFVKCILFKIQHYLFDEKAFENVSPGNWTWHWLKWTRRVIKRWNLLLWAIVTCTSFKILSIYQCGDFWFFGRYFLLKMFDVRIRESRRRLKFLSQIRNFHINWSQGSKNSCLRGTSAQSRKLGYGSQSPEPRESIVEK